MLENSRGRFAWPPLNCYDGSGPNKRVAARRGNVIDNKAVHRTDGLRFLGKQTLMAVGR